LTLVLLVDDDPLVADIVASTLRPAGYTVGVLEDGRGACGVVEFKRPALVLLDCVMPFIPGIEVLRQIRSSRTSYGIPVLMLTARASVSDREIAMRAGATGYMQKPFEAEHLVMRVEKMIADSHSDVAKYG
jgi:DNA-binding response OmpR family regulator